jgi:hypothetical protein
VLRGGGEQADANTGVIGVHPDRVAKLAGDPRSVAELGAEHG